MALSGTRWRKTGCAPREDAAKNGPSRCSPSSCAPSTVADRASRKRSITLSSNASSHVMVVGTSAVVPWAAWVRAIVCSACTVASIASAPPPPCTCRSINPGRMYPPSASARCTFRGQGWPISIIRPSSIRTEPFSSTRCGSTSRPLPIHRVSISHSYLLYTRISGTTGVVAASASA